MIAFMQYTIQVVMAFPLMSLMFIILPRAVVSAGRIAQVLKTEPLIEDAKNPKQFSEQFSGTIEFRNVSFRYPDAAEDALHDISFIAHPGEMMSLLGNHWCRKVHACQSNSALLRGYLWINLVRWSRYSGGNSTRPAQKLVTCLKRVHYFPAPSKVTYSLQMKTRAMKHCKLQSTLHKQRSLSPPSLKA